MNEQRNDAVVVVLTKLATEPTTAEIILALTDLYDKGFEQGYNTAIRARNVADRMVDTMAEKRALSAIAKAGAR